MEDHPIPQDITGFQFKLVGKMTVKQFVYVASGVLLAWLVYFVLKIPGIISIPLAIIFAGVGAALAFLPIDGRPMDVMLGNFIRAIFAPTQYIYGKEGGNSTPASPASVSVQNIQNQTPLVQAPIQSITQPLVQQTVPTFNQGQPQPVAQTAAQTPTPPLFQEPKPEEEEKVEEAEKKAEEEERKIQQELAQAKAQEQATNSTEQQAVTQKTDELQKMLEKTTRQKEQLEQELLILRGKLESQKQEKFTPSQMETPQETPNVKEIPPNLAPREGIPDSPEEPNLITGIVKDSRGNPLQNILVEVKDEEDNPVRAFKTNGLGEFASATTLANGKYAITLEDPKLTHKFDTVTITATGAPLMPLEMISIDPREELRRELFN